MVYVFMEETFEPLMVGPQFKTEDYAKKAWALIQSWNYEEVEDKDGNVVLSFVIDNDNSYRAFIFPSPTRKTIKEFSKVAEDGLTKKERHEPYTILIQFVFCKNFLLGPNTLRFKEKYKNGTKIIFCPFWKKPDGGVERIYSVKPIIKYNCKIKRLDELTKEDFELEYIKSVSKRSHKI